MGVEVTFFHQNFADKMHFAGHRFDCKANNAIYNLQAKRAIEIGTIFV